MSIAGKLKKGWRSTKKKIKHIDHALEKRTGFDLKDAGMITAATVTAGPEAGALTAVALKSQKD